MTKAIKMAKFEKVLWIVLLTISGSWKSEDYKDIRKAIRKGYWEK